MDVSQGPSRPIPPPLHSTLRLGLLPPPRSMAKAPRPRCSLLKPPFVPKLHPLSSLRSVFPPLYSMRGGGSMARREGGLLGSTFLIKLPPSSPQHLPRHLNASPLSRCCCCCPASLCPKKKPLLGAPQPPTVYGRGGERKELILSPPPSTKICPLHPLPQSVAGWMKGGGRGSGGGERRRGVLPHPTSLKKSPMLLPPPLISAFGCWSEG